ncbi:hypothetical protein LXL04_009614 [Taraxacum kok-saghyz]
MACLFSSFSGYLRLGEPFTGLNEMEFKFAWYDGIYMDHEQENDFDAPLTNNSRKSIIVDEVRSQVYDAADWHSDEDVKKKNIIHPYFLISISIDPLIHGIFKAAARKPTSGISSSSSCIIVRATNPTPIELQRHTPSSAYNFAATIGAGRHLIAEAIQRRRRRRSSRWLPTVAAVLRPAKEDDGLLGLP